MATFAVLVEFDLPEGVPFDAAAVPLMNALRTTTPYPPESVTAYAGEAAETVVRAGRELL